MAEMHLVFHKFFRCVTAAAVLLHMLLGCSTLPGHLGGQGCCGAGEATCCGHMAGAHEGVGEETCDHRGEGAAPEHSPTTPACHGVSCLFVAAGNDRQVVEPHGPRAEAALAVAQAADHGAAWREATPGASTSHIDEPPVRRHLLHRLLRI